MSITTQKEYGAIDDSGTLIQRAPSEPVLRRSLREQGRDPDNYDIVALPKPYKSFFI